VGRLKRLDLAFAPADGRGRDGGRVRAEAGAQGGPGGGAGAVSEGAVV